MRSGLWCVISFFACILSISYHAPAQAQQSSPSPEEARNLCDTRASHPRDPNRYLAGVPDEQFGPGAAIEACELAVKLNPNVPRLLFQLGRAYWMAQRDKEAVTNFLEAANSGYAAAMKYVGDAYLEGRGLPSSVKPNAQNALEWYRKAADGGFRDADKAVREIEEKLKSEAQQALDPSIFQRPLFMSTLYFGVEEGRKIRSMSSFIFYVAALHKEIDGKIIFLENGSACKPLLSGIAITNMYSDMQNWAVADPDTMNNIVKASEQGRNDMVTLYNRYGCKSDVTTTIMHNINAVFGVGALRSGASSKDSRESTQQHTVTPASAYRDPTSQANVLKTRIRAFIDEYHNAAANDIRQLSRFYADTIDYGRRGITSRDYIMREKLEVAQKCPRRSYSILEDSFRVNQTAEDRVDVEFEVDTICTGGRRETRNVWRNYLSLNFSRSAPLIVAQRGELKSAD